MALYDKDGNVYKLAGYGVKPISNDKWDVVKLHNIDNHDEVVAEDLTLNPDNYKGSVSLPEAVMEDIEVAPPIEKVEKPVENELDAFIKHNKVIIWCLPAKSVTTEDPLYGSKTTRVVYEDKFKFEGVVINQDDLEFQVWTNQTIGIASVLFPVAKKAEDRDSRWWRVISTEEQNGGVILSCMPSDYCPDFT